MAFGEVRQVELFRSAGNMVMASYKTANGAGFCMICDDDVEPSDLPKFRQFKAENVSRAVETTSLD